MSKIDADFDAAYVRRDAAKRETSGWGELWRKEDWWAIWLGIGIVLAAYILFANGSSIKSVAVKTAKWSTAAQLGADLSINAARYLGQFAFWLATFTIALTALGHKASDFVP